MSDTGCKFCDARALATYEQIERLTAERDAAREALRFVLNDLLDLRDLRVSVPGQLLVNRSIERASAALAAPESGEPAGYRKRNDPHTGEELFREGVEAMRAAVLTYLRSYEWTDATGEGAALCRLFGRTISKILPLASADATRGGTAPGGGE